MLLSYLSSGNVLLPCAQRCCCSLDASLELFVFLKIQIQKKYKKYERWMELILGRRLSYEIRVTILNNAKY